jgi:hypothetical protein
MLAEAVGLRYGRMKETAQLTQLMRGRGVSLAEITTERPGQAALRAALTGAADSVL